MKIAVQQDIGEQFFPTKIHVRVNGITKEQTIAMRKQYEKEMAYNQYYGYSGFDEFAERYEENDQD